MSLQKVEVTRKEAIKLFFKAINHEDPYWTDLVEDHLVFDESGENVVAWPNCFDVGRSLGFSDEEMETAEGIEPGRLKKLGL